VATPKRPRTAKAKEMMQRTSHAVAMPHFVPFSLFALMQSAASTKPTIAVGTVMYQKQRPKAQATIPRTIDVIAKPFFWTTGESD